MLRRLVIACLLPFLATPAFAQPSLTLTIKPGNIDRLVRVMAHEARCVALQENQGWLAFGHDREFPEASVSLYKLDAQGLPGPKAISWKVPPLPASLAKEPVLTKEVSFPIGLAFHPKLPLLYVWQEIQLNPAVPKPPAGLVEYDHLAIYDISKNPPQLVISLCRGNDFLFGQQGGVLAVDPEGAFLYIGNFRDDKTPVYQHVGRFPLDADGLPRMLDKDAPLSERLKQLAALNVAKSFVPKQRTVPEYVNLFPNNPHGTAQSLHVLSRDTILMGGYKAALTWRPEDKLTTVTCLPVKYAGPGFIAVHPKLPAVYMSRPPNDSLFHLQQIEGNWTMLPIQWVFPDRNLTSQPAILTKTNQVAVGGRHHVYLINIDADGHARPEALQMQVFNNAVRALVYSEKFDRLYVSVDLSR